MTASTIRERFETARDRLRERGIITMVNKAGCCNSCIYAEIRSMSDRGQIANPILWHHAGQERQILWHDGLPEIMGGFAERIIFNHANGGVDIAKQAFEDAGFKVEWDGTDGQALSVIF